MYELYNSTSFRLWLEITSICYEVQNESPNTKNILFDNGNKFDEYGNLCVSSVFS